MPASGAILGGEPLVVKGVGFTDGDQVLVGGVKALGVSVVSPTEIVALSPAGKSGVQDVVVSDGQTFATLQDGFRYTLPLRLDSCYPPRIASTGAVLTLYGQGLSQVEEVVVGTQKATLLNAYFDHVLVVWVPEQESGVWDIRALSANETALRENAVAIGSVPSGTLILSPNFGNTAGETTVYIATPDDVSSLVVNWSGELQEALPIGNGVFERFHPQEQGLFKYR